MEKEETRNSEVKTPFAFRNGILIHISTLKDYELGKKCNCVCPECGGKLIARKGRIRKPHFAHLNENSSKLVCKGGLESALHLLVKDVITKGTSLRLPYVEMHIDKKLCSDPRLETEGKSHYFVVKGGVVRGSTRIFESRLFDTKGFNVFSEKNYGVENEVRADISIEGSESTLLVEVYVRHKVPREKIEKIKILGHSAIELDFSSFSFDFENADNNIEMIKHRLQDDESRRWWLYNKKAEEFEKQFVCGDIELLSDVNPENVKKGMPIESFGVQRTLLCEGNWLKLFRVYSCPKTTSFDVAQKAFYQIFNSCKECSFFGGTLWNSSGTAKVLCKMRSVSSDVTKERMKKCSNFVNFENRQNFASEIDRIVYQANPDFYKIGYSVTAYFKESFEEIWNGRINKTNKRNSFKSGQGEQTGFQSSIKSLLVPKLLEYNEVECVRENSTKVLIKSLLTPESLDANETECRKKSYEKALNVFSLNPNSKNTNFKKDFDTVFDMVWDEEYKFAIGEHKHWTYVRKFLFFELGKKVNKEKFTKFEEFERECFIFARKEMVYIVTDDYGKKHSLMPYFSTCIIPYWKGVLPKPCDPSDGVLPS